MKIKKLCIFSLSAILGSLMIIYLMACQNNSTMERNYNKKPLTEEEVIVWTNEHFFDKDGKAYKSFWEDSWINKDPKKLWKYNGEDITGFDVQKIKGFDGRENYYLIEFKSTGYYFVCAETKPNAVSFQAYPSPFKMYNVSLDRCYAAQFGSAAPMCGIECKPGYIVPFNGLEKVFDVGYDQLPTTMRVYDSAKAEWTSMYVGVFDPNTATWKEETLQLYYRDYTVEPLVKEDVDEWTRTHFFDENGKVHKFYWEDAKTNTLGKRIWDIYEDITGFNVQEEKGFDGNKYYLVDFQPTGYFIVRADKPMNAYTFHSYENPFKIYNVPKERQYVYLESSAYFGVDWKENYYVTIREPVLEADGTYSLMKAGYVYDISNKRFDNTIRFDGYDEKTFSWKE